MVKQTYKRWNDRWMGLRWDEQLSIAVLAVTIVVVAEIVWL